MSAIDCLQPLLAALRTAAWAAGGQDQPAAAAAAVGDEHAPAVRLLPAPSVALMLAIGPLRRRLRRQRFEARLVRVVAVRAQQILLGAVPVAGAAAVHAGAPVAIFLSVALAAEPVGLLERHRLAAGQVQPSRLLASWQSRHQRCVSSCLRTMSVCIAVSSRRVRSTGIPAWQSVQGKMPSLKRRRRNLELSAGLAAAGFFGPSAASDSRPRQQQTSEKARYAQRNSTIRCISRSHIVWKNCSRSPMTPARFSETA